MFSDDVCSADDIRVLKRLCVKGQLTKCYECCYVEPNAGFDDPYCMLLTKKGKGSGEKVWISDLEKYVIPYRLKEGTIPKKCKYWKSAENEQNKRESKNRITKIQSAINKLTLKERKQLKL